MFRQLTLGDRSRWQSEVGLLPVALRPRCNRDVYVLLNGANGSFCLDLEGEQADDPRSTAWSANVGSYVTVTREHVDVRRWDRSRAAVERYSRSSVENSLRRFQAYLASSVPASGRSVVAHAVRVFRILRAKLGATVTGAEALEAFLVLLACATDGEDRQSLRLDVSSWGLRPEAFDVAQRVSAADWRALGDALLRGRREDHLDVHLDLLLRHSAGQLFQEAHYDAVYADYRQVSLDGFLGDTLTLSDRPTGTSVHFTPPVIARSLVEEAVASLPPDGDLVVFDPACGSGEFLREFVRQLEISQRAGSVRLIGWDISEAACAVARFVLHWETRNGGPSYEVRCVDSLQAISEWPKEIDVVLMNPPFRSWQRMTQLEKQLLREVIGKDSQGRPDLASAFILRAAESLREGGFLGTILPASFLSADSSEKPRQHLSQHLTPSLLGRLGNHLLFPNALVDVGIYAARKDSTDTGRAIALWADHRASSTDAALRELRRTRTSPDLSRLPIDAPGYSLYTLTPTTLPSGSWAPRPYSSLNLLESLRRRFQPVGSLFEVRQGARTGLKSVFVLSRTQWLELPHEERQYFRPAVVGGSIRRGRLHDIARVFFPYGEADVVDEDQLRSSLPVFYSHLAKQRQRLLERGGTSHERWWQLSRPREWQVVPLAKIVSAYFGDAGSYAWDHTGDYVVVQGYAWLPRQGWLHRSVSFDEEESEAPQVLPEPAALAYIAILNSPLFSRLLSAVSNNVAGGQWDLSSRFVNDIPIPDLLAPEASVSLISELATAGADILAGSPPDPEFVCGLASEAYGIDGAVF